MKVRTITREYRLEGDDKTGLIPMGARFVEVKFNDKGVPYSINYKPDYDGYKTYGDFLAKQFELGRLSPKTWDDNRKVVEFLQSLEQIV